jgi:hypothetical protein
MANRWDRFNLRPSSEFSSTKLMPLQISHKVGRRSFVAIFRCLDVSPRPTYTLISL